MDQAEMDRAEMDLGCDGPRRDRVGQRLPAMTLTAVEDRGSKQGNSAVPRRGFQRWVCVCRGLMRAKCIVE